MELGGESGLAAESYHSDSADAETISHSLLARLALRRDDGWWSRLTLRHDAGLTLDDNGGSAGLGRFGERWDLELGATLTRSDEGALSTPLLLFDPDSLASRVADSQAYWRRGGVLRLDWHALDWSAALDADLSDLDYDEASDILADQRELRVESRLDRVLGEEADLRVGLRLGGRALDYRGRDGSDREELLGALRLARDLERAELSLSLEGERHRPRDPEAVAYYERPDGSTWTLGAEALVLGDRGDWSLRVDGGRENWTERENSYFNPGTLLRAEFLGGRPLDAGAVPARVDLSLSAERFAPDALPSGDDLRRPRQLRLESSLRYGRDRAGRFPLTLGLLAEHLRQESSGVDHFLVLEASVEPGWRPRERWLLALALRADNYRSSYDSDAESESEWGLSAALSARYSRTDWELELRLARRDYYSFLLESEASRDAEAGLRIRWHP